MKNKQLYNETGHLTEFGLKVQKKTAKKIAELFENDYNSIDFERMIYQELTYQIMLKMTLTLKKNKDARTALLYRRVK